MTIQLLSDVQLIKTGNKGRSHETTLRNTAKIAPFFSDASSSIYKPKVPDITNCVLASWGCLQCCPPVSADPLPTCGIANSFCHQQVQVAMAWSVETD